MTATIGIDEVLDRLWRDCYEPTSSGTALPLWVPQGDLVVTGTVAQQNIEIEQTWRRQWVYQWERNQKWAWPLR